MPTDSDPRDEESGQWGQKYQDKDFLDAIPESDRVSTRDVTESIGCSHTTTWDRLTKLEDAGIIDRRQFGDTDTWQQVVSKEDILNYLEGREVSTSQAISDDLDIPVDLVKEWLYELEDEGEVLEDKIGSKIAWAIG